MEITLTQPIEEFINKKIQKGYADPSEVARQAFLRWMEQEDQEFPPRVEEKLQQAANGRFKKGSRGAIKRIVAGAR